MARDRTRRKVAKTRSIRSWTSRSGRFTTRPSGSRIEAHGEGQGQLAALGLVEQAGGQPALDRMQLQFRDLALQPEEQAPVDRGGVVDPVPVADEAMAVTAQVEHLIPVGAVA